MVRSIICASVLLFGALPVHAQKPADFRQQGVTYTLPLDKNVIERLIPTVKAEDRILFKALPEEDHAMGGEGAVTRFLYARHCIDEVQQVFVETKVPITLDHFRNGRRAQLVLPYVLQGPTPDHKVDEVQEYQLEYRIQKAGGDEELVWSTSINVRRPSCEHQEIDIAHGAEFVSESLVAHTPDDHAHYDLEVAIDGHWRRVEFLLPAGYTAVFKLYGEGDAKFINHRSGENG
ncbi:MAG: hypothetical protein KDD62_15975, partial [Bdellovibrionales bacterium]|nr:hypothetical protein [Bdellovibrionales bacterium]